MEEEQVQVVEPVVEKKAKLPRTEKQIAATEKMKEMRHNKRKAEVIDEPQDPEKKKSVEMATAMFMDMRKKEKEAKKDFAWQKSLDTLMTRRMDDFEERMVNMFSEPIDHFLKRRKTSAKKVDDSEAPKTPPTTTSTTTKLNEPSAPTKRVYSSRNPFASQK